MEEDRLIRGEETRATVSDLVYEYLSRINSLESRRKQRNDACRKFRRRNARRKALNPSRILPAEGFQNNEDKNDDKGEADENSSETESETEGE
ncbi:hypothetical protein KM043_001160 [Ampulex compressa]|nr:hypothetical protein KM043_001160 [Ampulex compressa]